MKDSTNQSRRKFLKTAVLAGGVFSIVPRHVLGGPGYTAPSDELTKAVIGVGGMGMTHLNYAGRTVAVCDVDKNHLNRALARCESYVDGYTDFRELLERSDVDIVHIPTPPHWHALIAIAAAKAGKDIWCEKPMTRTIGEGIKVVEAVQKNGRMFRLNTWFRFKDTLYGFGTTVKPIKKIVENRLLGWPLTCTVNAATGFNWKFYWSGKTNLVPEPVPSELDYDFWLGPAPVKPYHPHRVHSSFRGYWDYDGGGLGDMGMHYLDPMQYLMEKDHTSPVHIEADAPQQHHDACGSWRRVELTYADGCKIILDGENKDKDAPFLQGPKGSIWPGLRSGIPNIEQKIADLPDPAPQLGDFHESVRTRQKFALNEDNGHRSCNIVNLAKIAVQLGRPLEFDPVTQRFVNDDEANRLAYQPMRGPWRL